MTTKEIQKAVQKYCILNGHTIVCPNVNFFFLYECDVLALRGGYAYEFELKISRSDFLADKKKKQKHSIYASPVNDWQKTKTPNFFTYAVPKGMVDVIEIPEYAGLVYVENGELTWVKQPPKLHDNKPDKDKLRDKVLQLFQQRDALGCTLLTHTNRERKRRFELHEAEQKERTRKFIEHAKSLKNNG